MKLKDVLELTMTDSLDLIAKNHLEIGKNAARDALKKAGCYAKNGRRGWFYEGDPAVLEKSIYDFIEKKNTQTSVKPENKQTLTKIHTYHVLAGRFSAADIKKAIKTGKGTAEFKTASGGKLWAMMKGNKIMLKDENGSTAWVTIADVFQKNGVIHEINAVVTPK